MADKPNERRGLGRGLSALMGDVSAVEGLEDKAPRTSERTIPVEDIAPNPDQPRRRFDPAKLDELAASISEKGIIQPLVLREYATGAAKYQIIAGERRWRAAQIAQVHEVPAVIRSFSDEEALEVAIIENIQRDDLNPVEEAEAYRRLMDTHGRTQDEMSKALGKSRSAIANSLRLLSLPDDVLEHLAHGRLTAGHARALIGTDDPSTLASMVISKGLSVREAEKLRATPAKKTLAKRPAQKDADTRALEDELSANIGARVSIDAEASGQAGKMIIQYKSLEELDDLCRRLSSVPGGTI